MTDKELMKQAPAYPEGDVVGPCVCGSWPGGKCLKCPWVGLTDEEIILLSNYDLEYAAIIGEVQRKLKEKNT